MTIPQEDVRHLLARTGFGVATASESEAFKALNYPQAVAKILDGGQTRAVSPAPAWLDTIPVTVPATMSAADRRALDKTRADQGRELKAWWYDEMLATPSPFTERMVLFWHNHFTSSLAKVKFPDLLFHQNELYRKHATGNFATLLHAVVKDPAMMSYLDTQLNRGIAPNENFARELLELFTLGEGKGYTEKDVREAARAFTGWRYKPDVGFNIDWPNHDIAPKTFLGRTQFMNGDDVVDILLSQPRIAEFIVEKLWREFISEAPEPAEVTRLAAVFRTAKYEMKPLLQALFQSEAFRDGNTRGALVKTPTELTVGTLRLVGVTPRDTKNLVNLGRTLGQDLFDPPNVKGWPGGLAWIDTARLPERYAFLNTIVGGIATAQAATAKTRVAQLTAQQQAGPKQYTFAGTDAGELKSLAAFKENELAQLILPLPPSLPPGGPGGMLGTFILDPSFQLK